MGQQFAVAAALGGGGARGLAHLGVLDVLQREGLAPDLIVGTSFGAIVGALYALNPDPAALKQRILAFLSGDRFKSARLRFIRRTFKNHGRGLVDYAKTTASRGVFFGAALSRLSYISEDDFESLIRDLIEEDIDMGQTKIPFLTVATDLSSGREVVLRRGSLARAVAASCAIPGVFPPVRIGTDLLVDGGWIHEVPIAAAREADAGFVIGVAPLRAPAITGHLRNGLDVLIRAGDITRAALTALQLPAADALIQPKTAGIHWTDFDKADLCITLGREAAEEVVPGMKRVARIARVKHWIVGN